MVDSEGRNLHAIIADQFENFVPRWSRDGPSIYFTSNRSGKWQIWKLELASGQKTQVTDRGGISAFESYHGSTLYYAKREFGGLFRRAVSGGPEVRVINALRVGDWGAFAVTESGIYFLDSEAVPRATIYYYDIRAGRSNSVLPLERMPGPPGSGAHSVSRWSQDRIYPARAFDPYRSGRSLAMNESVR
jgi:hypothetical protein